MVTFPVFFVLGSDLQQSSKILFDHLQVCIFFIGLSHALPSQQKNIIEEVWALRRVDTQIYRENGVVCVLQKSILHYIGYDGVELTLNIVIYSVLMEMIILSWKHKMKTREQRKYT